MKLDIKKVEKKIWQTWKVKQIPEGGYECYESWIDKNDDIYSTSGAEDQFYLQKNPPYRTANNLIHNLDELRLVRGFDAETVKKIKPYVAAIPYGLSLIHI